MLLSWISNRGHDFLKSSATATCYRVAAAAVEGDLCTFESPRINNDGVREGPSRGSQSTLREPAGCTTRISSRRPLRSLMNEGVLFPGVSNFNHPWDNVHQLNP